MSSSASTTVECRCRCECGRRIVTSTPIVVRNSGGNASPNEAEAAEAVPVLEGLAMAGLVNILRQLGDLAGLAADVLDGLQDQVAATSARGRRLAVRAKQLQLQLQDDADQLPPSSFTAGKDLKVSHGVVAGASMPRIVAGHIKRCRGPPALSVLDRFDGGGEGACLKRYTDPSFFRTHSAAKLQQDMLMLRQPTPRAVVVQKKKKHESYSDSEQQQQQQQQLDIPSPPSSFTTTSAPEQFDSNLPLPAGQSGDELVVERTSSFEAWLSPPESDTPPRFFFLCTAAAAARDDDDDDDDDETSYMSREESSLSSHASTTKGAGVGGKSKTTNNRWSRHYRGSSSKSMEMIASRFSRLLLPRKLQLAKTKRQQDDGDPSSRSSAATAIIGGVGVGDSIISADECSSISSDPQSTSTVLLQCTGAGVFRQQEDPSPISKKCSTKVEADAPPPPIPPIMQWLPDKVCVRMWPRPAAASNPSITRRWPRPRTQSQEALLDHDNDGSRSNDAALSPQAAAETTTTITIIQEAFRDSRSSSSSQTESETAQVAVSQQHGQPFREDPPDPSPVQQQASEEHVVGSDSSSRSSNLQKESTTLMSPPPPAASAAAVPPTRYYSLLDDEAGSPHHDRITLRNGPSLIHPSRNILDSTTTVLLEQIKDKSFSLKPVSGASSPSPATN